MAPKCEKKTQRPTYEKKTQREHILLRPDTYIGSVEKEVMSVYVPQASETDTGRVKMVKKQLVFTPGLFKIFDEVLVNASDNKQRCDLTTRIDITVADGVISIRNNGAGIPVEMHEKEPCYVPELIFGHLLTSSNYDDTKKRTTGGRNGYGSKLANTFSTRFRVHLNDGTSLYTQEWTDNMSVCGKPVIRKKKQKPFTEVSFTPDLARFGLDSMDTMMPLFHRRAYDVAGTTPKSLKVYFNGEKVKVDNFTQYVNLYPGDVAGRASARNEHYEVMAQVSEDGARQVSFVNHINTLQGGTHVNMVRDQILTYCRDKGMEMRHVRENLALYVNALVENPAFDTQTKVTLTTRRSNLFSLVLDDKFLQKVHKAVKARVEAMAEADGRKKLKKTDGRKVTRVHGIPKLDDANFAGGRRSHECTLILTEGDSAKALAVSGLSVVGRDRYGVFPLKGKLLNVRDAASKTIENNEEIQKLKKILGLKQDVRYDSPKALRTLRYGKVMIMTDQDVDGSHIKGLLINLFAVFWPELLETPGFLVEFITPIVKATRRRVSHSFYTVPEYESWLETADAAQGQWNIKYYKGLGTSTSKEGREYFSDLDRHMIRFEERDDGLGDVAMAFDKKRAGDRKTWLSAHEPGTFLDMNVDVVSYGDFVNKELVLYSVASNLRAIPSVMDGLKPGQRKILYTFFKRNLTKELKVAQASGSVSEVAAYHHGEVSLHGTMTGMAQNYCGSNNVNLLLPNGQFGTRLQGGKDAASPRYIFTALAPVARTVFPKDDDVLLKQVEDDGTLVEPEWYAPVLPMVLVNGSSGIGTGWSSSVPNYNPRDLVRNLRLLLRGEAQAPLTPWYKGFTGEIVALDKGRYETRGHVQPLDDGTLRITELPVGSWTQDYKMFLSRLVEDGQLQHFDENHTDTTVSFTLHPAKDKSWTDDMHKKLRLTSRFSTTNMVLFAPDHKLKHFGSAEEIVETFFRVRLDLYEKRKAHQLAAMADQLRWLINKVRFVSDVVHERLRVWRRPAADVERELEARGQDKQNNSYDYLLNTSLRSLTAEKVAALEQAKVDLEREIALLDATSPSDLYHADLDTFLEALQAHEDAEVEVEKPDVPKKRRRTKSEGPPKKRRRKQEA